MYDILEYVWVYLLWTFVLWLGHWYAHASSGFVYRVHNYHHEQYIAGAYAVLPPRWVQLTGFYTTDWREIMEQVMTEIVPTLPICIATGHWWPLAIIWFDNAFISPHFDHDASVRRGWWFAYGVYHTLHHDNPNKNYGFYTVIWDILFQTFIKPPTQRGVIHG